MFSATTMVLIVEGISEKGAHASTNFCYLSFLRHSIRSRAVTYRIQSQILITQMDNRRILYMLDAVEFSRCVHGEKS